MLYNCSKWDDPMHLRLATNVDSLTEKAFKYDDESEKKKNSQNRLLFKRIYLGPFAVQFQQNKKCIK